ncbi:hypothetical protein BH09MYX1_BH09MYX1_60570 [soil metagenome]
MGFALLRRASLAAFAFSALALLATAATAQRAHAAPPPPKAAQNQEAERLFREAIRLRDSGDFAAACPKFADSFAVDPAPGTLVNLGDCEVRLGKIISAAAHYKLAAAGFPKGDKRRDLVAQKAAELEPKFAHLTITLAPSVTDAAKITRGGAPLDRKEVGVSVAVDPGKLPVVVSLSDHEDSIYELTLDEGQTKDLVVDVGAAETKASPIIVEKPVAGISPMRAAGFVVGGVGIVGLGLGVVTGILAMGKASTVKEHCDTTTYACDPDGVDAARAGEVLAPLSTVAFIAGGVLLAGGLVMVLVGGKKKEASVSFVPSFGPSGASGAFVGSF